MIALDPPSMITRLVSKPCEVVPILELRSIIERVWGGLKMFRIAAVIALLALVSGTGVHARSVHAEFEEAWSARDARYQVQYSSQADAANVAMTSFTDSIKTDASADVTAELFRVAMDRVHVAAITRGRGKAINELNQLVEKKPSAARGELWMQEQVSGLHQRNVEVTRLQVEMQKLSGASGLIAIVDAMQRWTDGHGELVGRTQELALIDENLSSYYKARSAENSQRAASRRAFFAGLGDALRDNAAQAHSPTSWPIQTTCRAFGGTTSCTTR